MMDVDLNSWLLFSHAATHDRHAEVVTYLPDGVVHRYTFGDFARRAQQLMHALDGLDIAAGARIATLAWNDYRHLETYFAVPCTDRVLHTANVRLSPEDLHYILDHARDEVVLVAPDLLPLLEPIAGDLPHLRHVIVMADTVPDTTLDEVLVYEDLVAAAPESYTPIEIDERRPSGICYTSGTTGRPKGVEYTHRSTVLHAMAVSSAAAMGIGRQDAVLPVVPMFHANAWGMVHAAVSVGSSIVFHAGALDVEALARSFVDERVTVAAGVPTVWLTAADALAARRDELGHVRHIICGGSQPPRSLIDHYRNALGIAIVQAWGMTETSPLASVAWPQHRMAGLDDETLTRRVRSQAGLPMPGVDISIRDEQGNEVPRDGETMGDLHVRGPWVTDSYLYGEGAEHFTADGWFATGDVAIGTEDGYFVIADRTKDLIKSGGEWISSVDMEAAIMAMDAVAEAAVIAIADPKWQERPMAFVVARPGATVTLDEIRAHLGASGFASWQLPERMELIDAVPKTAVGKFDKKVLRIRVGDV